MAGSSQSLFGSGGFNAANFRDIITSTMTMGLPNAVDERATFRWTPGHTWASSDLAGSPWDWSDPPETTTTLPDVQIPVALEFTSRQSGSREEAFGRFDASRAKVYIQDQHFDEVKGADIVWIHDTEYFVMMLEPPVGLFDFTLYTLVLEARDEV